jgi:hypothetical protein
MPKRKFELNAGTGIALGVIGGALLAVLVMALTGIRAVWVWALPVGAAAGVAIGASASRRG